MRGSIAVNELSKPASPGATRLLRLCRRLDWRFLLPQPMLRSVGYFGESGDLLSALEAFSESVVLLTDPPVATPPLDIAVLRFPSLEAVRSMSSIVKPGGHVYIEFFGALGRAIKPDGATPSRELAVSLRYARTLWGSGFDEIQPYWHRPKFDDCHEIVPLFDRTAMNYVLRRDGTSSLLHDAMLAASRGLMRLGLLRHLVPCCSIIAHKRTSQELS